MGNMKEKLTQEEILIYTSKSRADKAINSLKGILTGINIDNVVTDLEIEELQLWAKDHKELINRNPFKEFMNLIKTSVVQNIPREEVVEDLYWLCQKYENDSFYYNPITSDLQILQGVCHGILADGIITEHEVLELDKWLNNNEHLNTYYPYDEIRTIIISILSDGKIEEKEVLILKAYINNFVKIKNNDISNKIDKETININITGLCTSSPNIDFQNKTFCITGILKSGNRSELEERIKKLGGEISKNVIIKTDYLIVGDNGNEAWAFSCYGRKVEKAINSRKTGKQISLIHEYDLMDAILDNE